MRPPRALRARPRALILACSAALTMGVVGIAAAQTGSTSGPTAQAVQTTTSTCGQAGKAVERPDAIPAALVPPGTVLTSSRRVGNRTLVVGVVPHDFRKAVAFYLNLPRAGYRNVSGDAEMDEAEAFFAGDGVRGKWKVNGILNCSDAVTLTLYVIR